MHEENDGHEQDRQCAKANYGNSKPDVGHDTIPQEMGREQKTALSHRWTPRAMR